MMHEKCEKQIVKSLESVPLSSDVDLSEKM
jgi:hypothetical protein